MAKDIRSLSRYNESTEQTEIFYPATTTDAIAHPTKRKSLTDVISDIETHNGAYDISAANSGTPYADLAAALDSNNGGGVPQSLQKGGMSVKFVQTSDNKYVQYMLNTQEWTINTSYWEKTNLEKEVKDNEIVEAAAFNDLYEKINTEKERALEAEANKVDIDDFNEALDEKADKSNTLNYDDGKVIAAALNNLNNKVNNKGNLERMDLTNVETLLLVGTSHTEGNGSLRDKSMPSYLSALSDWNLINLGTSGCDYVECLFYLLRDISLTGSKWSDVISGGICLDFLGGNAENPYAQPPMDGKYTAENIKRLYSVIRSKGFDIVTGSYWGDQNTCLYDIQKQVAREMNLASFNINNDCYRINQKNFLPYWYNAHFASRTVANQFFTLLHKYSLRRPKRAIKLFRNRVAGANNDTLLYNNLFERVEHWREISVGHRAIKDGYENYVDRQDLYIDVESLVTAPREYTQLRVKSAIEFADKALVEFILPCTAYNTKDLKLFISTADADNATVYISKYQDVSLAIPLTPAAAVFIITGGVDGISIGDVFTDTLNSEVTFTVSAKDANTNQIICSASDTYVTPGQTTDTLTRVSDSQIFIATSLISGVPRDYPERAFDSHGMWEEITVSADGSYHIDNPELYMDYDKISILIDNEQSQFTINDVYATFVNKGSKHLESTVTQQYFIEDGTVVLEDTINNTAGTIDNTHGSYIWDGRETYLDKNSNSVTNRHIPAYYVINKNVNSILHLKKGDSLHYNIAGFDNNTISDGEHKYHLIVVCRYFPSSNLDINAQSFTITPQTFDFGKLGIKYNIGLSSVFTDTVYIPASFIELHKDIYFDAYHSDNMLDLIAVGDDIEIAYVKLTKIY